MLLYQPKYIMTCAICDWLLCFFALQQYNSALFNASMKLRGPGISQNVSKLFPSFEPKIILYHCHWTFLNWNTWCKFVFEMWPWKKKTKNVKQSRQPKPWTDLKLLCYFKDLWINLTTRMWQTPYSFNMIIPLSWSHFSALMLEI